MTDLSLNTGWTDEREAILTELWAKGLSCSQIAKALGGGVTRNAVIGKRIRMKIPDRVTPSAPPKAAYRKPAPPAVKKVHLGTGNRDNGVAPSFAATPLPKPRLVQTDAEPRTLVNLTSRCCRWPVSGDGADTLFCAAVVDGEGPYCAGHAAIAFQTRTTTRSELARSLRKYA